jgi:hypothetical protein
MKNETDGTVATVETSEGLRIRLSETWIWIADLKKENVRLQKLVDQIPGSPSHRGRDWFHRGVTP